MITDLPLYVYIVFFMALIYSIYMFFLASQKDKKLLSAIILIGVLQSILAIAGFYQKAEGIPPRISLGLFPLVFLIFTIPFVPSFRTWAKKFDLKMLTYLSLVRIPVEFVILWVYLAGYAPELMTFEGRNFDIISGITAGIVGFLAFNKNELTRPKLLFAWNVMSLLLLLNIVINATLATPSAIQQFAFDQPNLLIINFPTILLPAIIVPLAMASHIISFVQLADLKK